MPKVEIDEAEFLQNKTLRETVAKIMANPDAALMVERALKTVDPNARTPRLDQAKLVEEPVKGVEKKLDDFIAAQNKANADREEANKRAQITADVQTGLSRLRANGWLDDGIKAVEKIMEEKGILDVDIAAAYFEKLHPPQVPVSPGGAGAYNFFSDLAPEGDADLKKMIESKGESEGVVDKIAYMALNEIRGASRR